MQSLFGVGGGVFVVVGVLIETLWHHRPFSFLFTIGNSKLGLQWTWNQQTYGVGNRFPQSFLLISLFHYEKAGVWLFNYGLFHLIWGMVNKTNYDAWWSILYDGISTCYSARQTLSVLIWCPERMGISDDVSPSCWLCLIMRKFNKCLINLFYI